MSARRVLALAAKEWREIVRDRVFLLLAFLLAPMQMVVFGYGMSQDVEHVPLAIVDHDASVSSRDYARHYMESRWFAFRGYLGDERQADRLLADGAVRVALVIPPRFGERLLEGRSTEIQTLIDGTFTRTARMVQAYVEAINAAVSVEIASQAAAARLGLTPERAAALLEPVRAEVRYLYNQEVRSIWAIGPSLVMFMLTLVVPLLMALNVVREKETGAIHNIYASTVTRAEFLAGKLLPNVGIAMINAVVLWLIAILLFRVPFRGSVVVFLGATAIYVVAASGFGLIVSLLVSTQQAALAVCVVLSIIVAINFSGMLTPLSSLTGLTGVIARLLPPGHFNNVMLDVFLKGGAAGIPWRDTLLPVAHAALLLAAAHVLFRKRTRT
jgi:ABC-2 type transport system permease protein/ribosome-dependent ATPase